MGNIRFGFIGAGQISYSAAASVNRHRQAKVIAAHDPNPERLARLCREHHIPKSCARVEELLADDRVDAVYIAVPNVYHAPLARQALLAGKHVILDKPFATSAREAMTVARAAEKSGKVFSLGMNQRLRPESQKVKALVAQGKLGEVYHGKAYWIRRAGIPKLGTWFGNRKLAGGGALYDIGVHLLDLCLHLMDNFEPVAVSGVTYTKFGNRGLGEGGWGMSDRAKKFVFDVDDFASALIRMANGATVTLDVTWACHTDEPNRNDVRLFGTEAGAGAYPFQLFRAGRKGRDYEVLTDARVKIPYRHGDRFHNFINHLQGREALCTSLEEALVVQRILDGIAKSCETGREVRLKL